MNLWKLEILNYHRLPIKFLAFSKSEKSPDKNLWKEIIRKYLNNPDLKEDDEKNYIYALNVLVCWDEPDINHIASIYKEKYFDCNTKLLNY